MPQPSKKHEATGGLLVVSNRLPYNLPESGSASPPKRNVGGLVNALEPVLERHGGSWIGWDGHILRSAAAVGDRMQQLRSWRTPGGVDLYGVPLSDREVSSYYHGFANRALWPLFHDLLPTAVFLPEDYATYRRVNERFAEIVYEKLTPGQRVWVHDYHLLLVPQALRQLGFRGRMDFFLHIPFPPPELFAALPWREPLLQGALGADGVAFHTSGYRDNFVRAAEALLGAKASVLPETGDVLLEHPAGITVAGTAPIGVDVEAFETSAQKPAVAREVQRIQELHRGRRILFSADRLDYTKGIRERFLIVERLLQRRPDLARTFVLVQVVVPSRHQVEEYRLLKREIDELAGRINAERGSEDWQPIHYLYRALDRERLVAHYRAASVGLITPLKDGMNLVALEFAASRTDGDGVLIVSERAGVAELLRGAILVNPYDREGCVDACIRALEMEAGERRARMELLRECARSHRLDRWVERCLTMAGRMPRAQPPAARRHTHARRGASDSRSLS